MFSLAITHLLDGVVELGVADARAVQAREQVADEAEKEGHVLVDELGQVHVAQRPHEHHVLGQVGRAALQLARHHQHGLERAQTEVVVALLGELLAGQLVQDGHLLGEQLGGGEALGEEHDLADLLQVGHDDDDGPEEGLDGVGQLGAARVARVHRDKHAHLLCECDAIAKTLTIMKSTKGNFLAGFTEKAWDSSGKYCRDSSGKYCRDSSDKFYRDSSGKYYRDSSGNYFIW